MKTLRTILLAACAALAATASSPAATRGLDDEAEMAELRAAMAEAQADPEATASLERFLGRYPASRHRAAALLALERAQIIARGHYVLPDGATEPRLTQLRPSQEHLQWFYEGQNELAQDPAALTDADLDALERRYRQLRAMDDPAYRAEADYYLGYIAYRRGRLDDALAHLDALPDEGKYAKTAPFYRAQVLMAMGRWDDARDVAAMHRGRTDLSPAQRMELERIEGECLLQRGQADEAYAHLRAYVEGSDGMPVIGGSAYNAALLAYRHGDQQLAQRALERVLGPSAMASAPSGPQGGSEAPRPAAQDALLTQHAYMLLGQSALLTGDYDHARMAFDQASTPGAGTDPDVAEAAAYNLATLVHQERYASPFGEEVTRLEDFLNRYPASPYADRIGEYLTDSYLTSRNYESALASIDRIKQPSARILTARQRLLFQLGTQQYANGLHADAQRTLTEAIALGRLNPTLLPQAHYWRGEARYRLRDDRGAERDLSQAAASPDAPAALKPLATYSLGYARFRQGNFDGAASAFAAYAAMPAERTEPTYPDALARLGDCLYAQRRFAEAESRYRQARQAAPQAPTADYALYQEAFMMGLQKKYDAKIAALASLLASYPDSERCPDAWLETGRTHLLMGHNQQALDAFRHVTDAYPTAPVAPQAAVQLAMTLNLMGQTQQALDAYRTVVERWPGTDEARTALEDLKTLYLDRGDVAGYDAYLASLGTGMRLSSAERDSLTLTAARRLAGEGRAAEAYQTLRSLLASTADPALRREQLPTLQQMAFGQADYAEVILAYARMKKAGGFEPHQMQQAQLLAARAHFHQEQPDQAMQLLAEAAADPRTAPGAEAAYLQAQTLADSGRAAEAKPLAEALIKQGTPHAYWLARTIILYSDLLADEGDAFRAAQYLKSLQKNYSPASPDDGDDIPALIQQRLKTLQQQ